MLDDYLWWRNSAFSFPCRKNVGVPYWVLVPCASPLLLTQTSLNSWHSSHHICAGFSTPSNTLQQQLGILQLNLVLILSTWRYCQIPLVKRSYHKTTPTSFQMSNTSMSPDYPQSCSIWPQIRGSQDLLLNEFARATHRTQGNTSYVYQFIKG